MTDTPAFEIMSRDGKRHLKVYEDGHIEGFEGAPGDWLIFNRIPALIGKAYAEGLLERA